MNRKCSGRACDQRVVWLDEIAAAKARLAEVTAATFPTAEDQRAALLYEAGLPVRLAAALDGTLRAEAERMGGVD